MKKLYTSILVFVLQMATPAISLAQGNTTGKIYLGYAKYDDQIWEYDGLSLDRDAKAGCAIVLTQDMLKPYVGGTIKSMRVGWDTSQMKGEYEGFVRTTFNGENLSTGKATVRYSYNDSNPGWNTMTMSDYVIPEDVDQLVVGFTTSLKKGICAIPTLYPHNVDNSCYLWVEGETDENGDPLWVDMKDRGILPILLTIQDTQGTFNFLPVVTMLVPDGIVTGGEPSDCLIRLRNAGSQTIKNLEVTSRQGEQTYSKKVTLSKSITTGTTSSSFLIPVVCFQTGDVELGITKVNDKEIAEPTFYNLNLISIPKEVAAQYTRRPLMEYYVSENNYRSPRYYDDYVGPMIKSKRSKITYVSQHMDDQFMNGDDEATQLALMLCDNDKSLVSVPAMTVDRAMNTGNYLVQINSSKTPMFDTFADQSYFNRMLNATLSVPTFVSVDVAGVLGDDGETLQVTVGGNIAEGILPEGEKPHLTVYLMEKKVKSDSQIFWTEKEKEEYLGEYTHENVIREVLTDMNGDETIASGELTASYTTELDPTWNTENLYLVAFVHRDGKLGGKFMHVFNSAEGTISTATGIETLTTDASLTGEKNIVYDLSGRKIANRPLPKGIYIINGKKIIIR